ncbi:MAG: polyhydroxyalkanoate synthesis regulator DNA-binding domain-containing protein [Candidatus Zixiibacteriota bacterium]
MKIIKRYKNRRLYDTELKKYITHEDINLMVKAEESFMVIENATGKDITLSVLGYLLIGKLKNYDNIKESKEILIETINLGGKKSMTILKNTFLAGIGIFNLTKKKAEEVVETLIKAGEIDKSDKKTAVMELLDKAEEQTIKMKDKVVKETVGLQKEFNKLSEKVKKAIDNMPQKKIMTELEKLNKKVDQLAKKVDGK